MYGLKEMLMQEQKHLESILRKLKGNRGTPPEGRLRISVDDSGVRYYQCVADRYGTYIPKNNMRLIKQLAQNTYDTAVIGKAEVRLRRIMNLLKDYSDDEIEQIYESMHHERQALVTPVEPTLKQLEEQWLSEPYDGKEFQEGTPVILTERGERVRSKSEKILADFFYRKGILYKYEKPLLLRNFGTIYPDFTFFSEKRREEIYWEHEEMLDNPEYAKSAVKKLNAYQMNGILPGERLILTYETSQDMLNSKVIGILTERYLR